MSENIAIKVDKVSKDFVLPHDKVDSVKGMVTSLTKGRAWKTKETQHALKNISFEVKQGEFFGIVGRNGSGKSTMLKILAGIYQPTSGKVSVSGKLVPFIELGVGFNGELTGRENIYLNGAMLGFSRKQIDEMYDEIVSFAELEPFMDQKLKNYSSGMQVRLAFSMATRAKADVLLVDEVLAVGDADFQHKCFDYFRKLKHDKKTVIFVSHDMNSVREYCDRAILIEKSKMILEGSADEVASKYTQIFLDEAKAAQETGTSKRWGDGAVTYDSLKFEYADKERQAISITATATAHREVHNPNFGFLVRSADGTAILGANSHNKRQMVKRLVPGQQVTVSWQFDNILNNGTHFVEPAIVYEGNITAEWWEEARKLTVRKAEPTPYPVNPDVTLDMSISEGDTKEKAT